MLRSNLLRPVGILILLVVLFLLPWRLPSAYHIHLFIYVFVLIILALGLRLIYTTGQVSFAHAAFYAVGAYCSALLVMRAGWSSWYALPVAGIIAAVIGLLVGYPTLRIKGVYFFLMSFAFGSVVTLVLSNYWTGFLGGHQGLTNIPPPNPLSIGGLELAFLSKIPYYYVALIFVILITIIFYRLDKSRFGMICKSIRDADILAECAGINIMKYKVLAFVIGCFFAGVAGGFIAHYYLSISPGNFGFHLSVNLVVYLLVGGSATVAGPIVGTAVLVLLAQLLVRPLVGWAGAGASAGAWEQLFYGVVLIVFISFLPEGLIGLPKRVMLSGRKLIGTGAATQRI